MCTYACTYVYTYVHTYIHMYTHTYICTYIHTYTCTHICTYVHLLTYVCTCTHMYTHIYKHAHSVYVHMYKAHWPQDIFWPLQHVMNKFQFGGRNLQYIFNGEANDALYCFLIPLCLNYITNIHTGVRQNSHSTEICVWDILLTLLGIQRLWWYGT